MMKSLKLSVGLLALGFIFIGVLTIFDTLEPLAIVTVGVVVGSFLMALIVLPMREKKEPEE